MIIYDNAKEITKIIVRDFYSEETLLIIKGWHLERQQLMQQIVVKGKSNIKVGDWKFSVNPFVRTCGGSGGSGGTE